MPDIQSFRIDALEHSLDEHKEEFRDFRREDLEWKKRMEDKMDIRASAGAAAIVTAAELAARVDRVDSRIDAYEKASKIAIGLIAILGGIAAWVLDIGDAIRKVFGKG